MAGASSFDQALAEGNRLAGIGGGCGLVGAELGQPFGQAFNGRGQVAHTAAGDVLLVEMVLFEQVEPLQLGVGLGQREYRRVAGGNRLDLGVREFLPADVIGAAGGVVAGDDPADEACLGFERLPHIGVERSLRDVARDRHLLVVVSLSQNAALALFDLRRLPRCVKVMQRY
jgi:hypothetical protein